MEKTNNQLNNDALKKTIEHMERLVNKVTEEIDKESIRRNLPDSKHFFEKFEKTK